jgi:hypothetical protein
VTVYSDNFDNEVQGDPLDGRELDQPEDHLWSDVYPFGGPSSIILNQDRAKCHQTGQEDRAGFAYINTDVDEDNPCISVAADLYVVDSTTGDPDVGVKPRVAYVYIGPADAISPNIYAGFKSVFDEESNELDAIFLRFEPANDTIEEVIGALNTVPNGARVTLTNDSTTLRVYYQDEETPRIVYPLPFPIVTDIAGIFSADVANDSAWDNFEVHTQDDCPDPPPPPAGGPAAFPIVTLVGAN